jgi:hypothetical protein
MVYFHLRSFHWLAAAKRFSGRKELAMTKTRKFKLIRVGQARRLTRGIDGTGLELPSFTRQEA